MADVFISYKQEEREQMRPIAIALISMGVDVWFDARLEPGTPFTREIMEQIDTCRAQVVCWSPAAIQSDWVCGEAEIGREREVLVPVMVAKCRLTPPFNRLHTENLTDWDGDPSHQGWHRVVSAMSRLLGRDLSVSLPEVLQPATSVSTADQVASIINSDLIARLAALSEEGSHFRKTAYAFGTDLVAAAWREAIPILEDEDPFRFTILERVLRGRRWDLAANVLEEIDSGADTRVRACIRQRIMSALRQQ